MSFNILGGDRSGRMITCENTKANLNAFGTLICFRLVSYAPGYTTDGEGKAEAADRAGTEVTENEERDVELGTDEEAEEEISVTCRGDKGEFIRINLFNYKCPLAR